MNGMPPRDTAMSLDEFRQYYREHERQIRSARAFDASDRRWVEGEDIFRTPGVYTLIVVRFRSGTFMRISVKPSLKVAYAPEKYASAGTWSRLGVHLTYEEKEFLESIGGEALSPEQLIDAVESSGFPGRDALAGKLRKAADAMRR
jgi:hypothetical protein